MFSAVTISHATLDGSIAELIDHIEKEEPGLASRERSYCVQIPVPRGEGSGHWTLFKLSPHLLILVSNVEYHRDREILVPSDTMVKVRVLLSGGLRSADGRVELEGTGAFVESYPGVDGSSYILRGGSLTRMVVLNCSREFFEQDLGLSQDYLPYPISHLFAREARAPEGSVVPLGPDVLRGANEVMRAQTRFQPPVIFPYLSAKAEEMACAMIAELNAARERPPLNARSSVRDVSRINEARDLILDQFQRPPTIPEMARIIGVNQTKLKALFKSTFGLTIHEFTQKCRMDRAAELLLTTDIGIGEIAYTVGYDHAASFTHAFRAFFGHAPSQVRRANVVADASASDAFICGGQNIYPRQIEKLLERHPDVLQAAVLAADEAINGQIPVAFVVRAQGATVSEDELKEFSLSQGAAHASPRVIAFLEVLPTGDTHKLDRSALKPRAAELAAQHAG